MSQAIIVYPKEMAEQSSKRSDAVKAYEACAAFIKKNFTAELKDEARQNAEKKTAPPTECSR